MTPNLPFDKLRQELSGELFTEERIRLMFATDASVYRELPLAVCYPMHTQDLKTLVKFAGKHNCSLIPRGAGTSLAGQVVGNGIVVDTSRYMNRILEINSQQAWVRVQPGVVLDELNLFLKPMGLFFGPETSTSNRCVMGGMVGNNSCGAHSLVYGSTREHTLEIQAVLSDGSETVFKALSNAEFHEKCNGNTLENQIYRHIAQKLSDKQIRQNIKEEFPHPDIKRRNTGYAIDLLMHASPFEAEAPVFNFCKLLAGSEGSLALFSEIKLNLVPLPPKHNALVCVHLESVEQALKANLIALRHKPVAVELIDKVIIDCTRENREQKKNRFFIQGEPGAILVVEFASEQEGKIIATAKAMEQEMRSAGLGYHFPLISQQEAPKVWALRKAGLGLLSNVPGDAKAVSVIEDTSVHVEVLPQYIAELNHELKDLGLSCVYHAHIATGELHLRPLLNLKLKDDVARFKEIALRTARLVKKFKGSLSGEHGDGRLRGAFIPLMIGQANYQLLQEIKNTWDPQRIFNPGKITDTPPITEFLRYKPDRSEPSFNTFFDFSTQGGILRAVEQCNGSGDCRKSELFAGAMCPSFHATRNESHTTRARANILREFLTNSAKANPFNHKEILETLDLCLSCKACMSECPSNVDMAKYKAEFLQQYYNSNGTPIRSMLIGGITPIQKLASMTPKIYNAFVSSKPGAALLKKIMGFAHERSVPLLAHQSFARWHKRQTGVTTQVPAPERKVWLFVDEFSAYNDVSVAIAAFSLLKGLGYEVHILPFVESGRTWISKGLLKKAKKIVNQNLSYIEKSQDTARVIGLEPSALLSFKDEYPLLASTENKAAAINLSSRAVLIDDFIADEFQNGSIRREMFTREALHIHLHGHCHQKALAAVASSRTMLEIPENYTVEEIQSGCCGMAGSFGYEKQHYEISMNIGELKLFPAVRQASPLSAIAAPGTSCRHQIYDGTGRQAFHPVELLYNALIIPDN